MRKSLCLTLIVLGSVFAGQSQTAEDAVKQAVQQLFTGMKTGDSALVVQSFWPDAIMQTIAKTKSGESVVITQSITGFGAVVAKNGSGTLDERISFGGVHIDGELASVWTPYTFYRSGVFSHAGTNSFQLAYLNGQWKIQYLIDTRRK